MPLKPCRECGQEVSTSAKTCPSCGVDHPAKTSEQTRRARRVALWALGIMTAAPLLAVGTCAVLFMGGSSGPARTYCEGASGFAQDVRSVEEGVGADIFGGGRCDAGTLRMPAGDSWRSLPCLTQVETLGALGQRWDERGGLRLIVTGAGGAELGSARGGRASIAGC